jgi:hypothetical protein
MSTASILERCTWRIPGMPHRGWSLVDVEELDEPEHTCEACGKTEIRYVHTIEHEDFRTLQVGCVCAEHLTGDYVNPRRRETELRNAAKRRDRRIGKRRGIRDRIVGGWDDRDWSVSAKGNPWTKADGMLVTVFPHDDGYRLAIGGTFGRRTYPDVESAKDAALGGFLYVHEKGD